MHILMFFVTYNSCLRVQKQTDGSRSCPRTLQLSLVQRAGLYLVWTRPPTQLLSPRPEIYFCNWVPRRNDVSCPYASLEERFQLISTRYYNVYILCTLLKKVTQHLQKQSNHWTEIINISWRQVRKLSYNACAGNKVIRKSFNTTRSTLQQR